MSCGRPDLLLEFSLQRLMKEQMPTNKHAADVVYKIILTVRSHPGKQ